MKAIMLRLRHDAQVRQFVVPRVAIEMVNDRLRRQELLEIAFYDETMLHDVPLGSGVVGAPDLFVSWQGRWLSLEVKSKGGKLSLEQQLLAGRAPVACVYSVAEALEAIGIRA